MSLIAVAGQTYTFGISVISQADTDIFQANPAIVAGDFQRSINGGVFGNLANLPTVTPALGKRIQIILSAAETTSAADGGNIYVVGSDQAGAEWQDIAIEVRVRASDLALEGADGDTLKTISDQIDGLSSAIQKGAIEYTYTLTNSVDGTPIIGADVWFSTDLAQANIVFRGVTDSFGVVRDAANEKPWLDGGTYFVWRQAVGWTFSNPDTEVVS